MFALYGKLASFYLISEMTLMSLMLDCTSAKSCGLLTAATVGATLTVDGSIMLSRFMKCFIGLPLCTDAFVVDVGAA